MSHVQLILLSIQLNKYLLSDGIILCLAVKQKLKLLESSKKALKKVICNIFEESLSQR